ncbi:MAG TPA: PilZ domain-containing protein [Allosphingosinicella sp.]|nr:PilZ domain-containing protein [Allosphingosinicella sp.]
MASAASTETKDPWADRRGEQRHEGLIESALLHFRGKAYRVPVLNISSRGAMVESALDPRLGEPVLVEFDQCSRMHAFVRWAREGRLGLNFGHELVLGD